MHRVTLLVAAGLFVAAAAITGLLRGDGGTQSGTTTPTSSTTTVPLAVRISPAEITVPPTVIVPVSIDADAGLVVVDYDLVPTAVGTDAAVRPTRWTLLAGSAEIPAEVDPSSSRVAFVVGSDFDPATITGIRLDEYVLRSPIQAWFRPAIDDFSAHAIAPGVSASLDIVQEQSQGAIVRVRLATDLLGGSSDLAAEGVGPGWVTASGNFGGGGLWTLSFVGETLPDPLPILVRGIAWIPVTTSLTSTLDGVPNG